MLEMPAAARDNTPDAIERALKPAADAGLLPSFPFGTDFTAVEQRLVPALEMLEPKRDKNPPKKHGNIPL